MTYVDRIAQYPQVAGECPACHGRTLFVGSGGYITCSYLSCPDPSAAHRALERACPECGGRGGWHKGTQHSQNLNFSKREETNG